MNRLSEGEPLSPDLMRQIEVRREEFERAWIDGQTPSMEDTLAGVSSTARSQLLRALMAVELEHRRNPQGGPITEQHLIGLHPQLALELKLALQAFHKSGTKRAGSDDNTLALPQMVAGGKPPAKESAAAASSAESAQYETQAHGLHIRCPHCSNPVELLAESAYDDISCASCGSAFSLADRTESAGAPSTLKSISRFELLECLGSGGFGTVWKARDPELDRIVAVKVPRGGQVSPTEVEFFFREARAAAQLRHPHIVPVHEVGRDDSTLFIVSDFVSGVTLTEWLKGHRPSPWEIAELGSVISDALHHAHQQGIIHRDLKPSNIMIDEAERPFLMDFGLAKREIGEITMTVDGQILGTPAYMSPEQAGGEGHWTDRRSDIYSLGVMVFEMLTGELPFRGNHQMQIQQRLTDDPPDPRKLNRHVPRDLATIAVKCMDRLPGRRYNTAADVAAEFRRFMNGEPIVARPISKPERLVRWAQRKPMVATTLALTIVLAIAGPAAALFIAGQRNRLAELVVEKDNLIGQMNVESKQSVAKITRLSEQLDLWEGRANPWEYWPPGPENLPRRNVVARLFDHSNGTLMNRWRNGNYDGMDRARGALGLAILADAMSRPADALKHYEQARDELAELWKQHPEQPQFARALAECYTALARLNGDENRPAAEENFTKARQIHEQLATLNQSDVAYQVELLESELDMATLSGFESGQDHLQRVAEIDRSLPANWPSEPGAVYQLACFLLQREPVLVTTATTEAAP
jgi:ribosomal protein S27E